MKLSIPLGLGCLLALSLSAGPQHAAAGGGGKAGLPALGPSGDTLRVSLEACVDRALSVSEEVQLADADRKTAHARYLQARSTALPQVSLSTTYTRQIESIFGGQGGGVASFEADTLKPIEQRLRDVEEALPVSGFAAISQLLSSSSFASKNTWNAALGVRQKLIQGGNLWGSIAAASHALKAATLLRQERRGEVVFQVRGAYLTALLADRGVEIAQLGLEQSRVQLHRVQLRQQAGTASEFELLQAEVAQENQVPGVKRAQANQELAYLDLCRLCNLPMGQPMVLTSPMLEAASVPPEPGAIDTLGLEAAAMRTSGLSALEQSLEARKHAVTVAASGLYPDFSLFANVSQQAYPESNLPKRHDWRRDINAGLAMSWQIFDGFLTKGAIEEARAGQIRAAQDLAQARELVHTAMVQGVSEVARSAADLEARSRTVELAKRAMDLANLRFNEGASSMLEVTDARLAWQMAQSNEAAARRDYFTALAQLERYTGKPFFAAKATGVER
jgi:outer membrane protein